jgi:hypothetical protein
MASEMAGHVPKQFWMHGSSGGSVKQRHSWLALVTFCAITVVVAALASAIVLLSATATYAAAKAFENAPRGPENFSGVISDSHCNGRHMMKDKSPEECVRFCVTQGAKYVLVNGENVYALDGKPAEFTSLSGERVTVNGTLDGTTIKVNSVKPIRPEPPGQ